jgi:DNA-binding MarR family transcriptional regulator
MTGNSQRQLIGDVAALIDRSGALFPDVDPSTVALWLLATRAGRLTEAFTREVLAEQGIDSTEFSILVVLLLTPRPRSTTMGELASSVVLSQPGTTRALQRAERNGNVRRRPDPDDGRAVVIELTDAGRDVVEKTMQLLLDRFEARLGEGFSTAQALTVASASAQYSVALDDVDEVRERGE